MVAVFVSRIRQSRAYSLAIGAYLIHTALLILLSFGLSGRVRIFTNTSDSMLPVINRGSLSIVISQSPRSYVPGDIITFSAGGDGDIITHRIHDIRGNVYVTKGDSNQAVDEGIVPPSRVIGRVALNIPYLGYWISFLKGSAGNFLFVVLPALCFIVCELAFLASPEKREK